MHSRERFFDRGSGIIRLVLSGWYYWILKQIPFSNILPPLLFTDGAKKLFYRMNYFCTTSACPYPVNCYHRHHHHRWKWQFCNFSWKYISFLYLLYFLFFSIAETGKAVNRPGRHICPWAFLGQPGRLVRVYLFEPGWLVGPPSQVPQPTWYFLAGWWVYLPWYISTAWQVGDGGAPWYIYRRHTHYSRLVDHHQKIDHKTVCMLTLFCLSFPTDNHTRKGCTKCQHL